MTDVLTRRRDLVAGFTANAIEWYDFAVFGALASVLAVRLFPPGDDSDRLVLVFAVFSTSFLTRPLGALVLGLRADRVGRRRPFAATILLMSVATALIGLVPPWSAVGVLAPALLLVLRMAQGFASGGGISTSIPFVLESVPQRHWGRYSGWHTATVAVGIATGIAVASVLAAVLTDPALESWGWRVAFLAALPLGAVGLAVRSPAGADRIDARSRGPVADVDLKRVWRTNRSVVCTGFALVSVLAGTFNVWFLFLPADMDTRGIHPLSVSLAASMGGLLVGAVVAPWFGAWSDRSGRSMMLVASTATLAVLLVPLYLLATSGSVAGLVIADMVVGVALGGLVISAYLVELMPADVRATGVALSYGMATALVGGTAPLIGSVLSGQGLAILVPVYLCGLCVVACGCVLYRLANYPQRVTPEVVG